MAYEEKADKKDIIEQSRKGLLLGPMTFAASAKQISRTARVPASPSTRSINTSCRL
jgi:hypothetical protein